MKPSRSHKRRTRSRSAARNADGRPPLASAFHTAHERACIAAGLPRAEDRTMRQGAVLVSKALWDWFWHILRSALDHAPAFLPHHAPDNGIYRLDNETTLALAADWGAGTDDAYAVADAITAMKPDVTVHLGDVYYTGSKEEFADFFLPEDCWPRGQKGTYALNGNHEMYSGGHGYFAALAQIGQQRSYFCLENDNWRIVALDTGYLCSGNFRVILAKIPLLRKLFHDSTSLPDVLVRWLRDTVFADAQDTRPVIFLSHHQPYSGFRGESEYVTVRAAIAPYLDRTVLWIWGHEHRMALYSGKAGVRGRCIGHGGIPVELPFTVLPDNRGLVVYDDRVSPTVVDGEHTGYNGFVMMHLAGPTMTLRYYDQLVTAGNTEDYLVQESWVRSDAAVSGNASLGPRGRELSLTGADVAELVGPVVRT